MSRIDRVVKIARSLACIVGLSLGLSAHAAYPDKPITMIVAYAPGGGTDLTARAIAPFIEKYLGNNARIIILNKTGAGGAIGFAQLASSPRGRLHDRHDQHAERAHDTDRAQVRLPLATLRPPGQSRRRPGQFRRARRQPHQEPRRSSRLMPRRIRAMSAWERRAPGRTTTWRCSCSRGRRGPR